jgi:hypothetical protein
MKPLAVWSSPPARQLRARQGRGLFSVNWGPASQFVEEVFQEDHVVPQLPHLSSLGRHHRHDALAIGSEVDVLAEEDPVRKRRNGPQPRLVGNEEIVLYS